MVGGGGFSTIGYQGPDFFGLSGYPFDVAAVAADKQGNVFMALPTFNVIARLDTLGGFTLVAGNGTSGYSGDNGPATSASLNGTGGITVDSDGSLYIADIYNNRIRKVTNGIITTVAGNGTKGFGGDGGPSPNAALFYPVFVAVDSTGALYISDLVNARIRKVSNGVITTVAGNGKPGFGGDGGSAIDAQLLAPTGIAVDSTGVLYIADTGNNRIRKVSSGTITTLAGGGTANGDNIPASSAGLKAPLGIALDGFGSLFIADSKSNKIRKISNGIITTAAGNGGSGIAGDDGPATSASLYAPAGVAFDRAGNLYIADENNFRVRRVSDGVITTVAGNGGQWTGGDYGPAINAVLGSPQGIAIGAKGELYIADAFGGPNRTAGFVRKVSSGVITAVAGGGVIFGDNIPATSKNLAYSSSVAVDRTGSVYISSAAASRIYKVSNGIITTLAGNASQFYTGENVAATATGFYEPRGIAVDSAGSLYIADKFNQRVRKVSNGLINTVAGNGTMGYGGDNGPAISAQLRAPSALALDAVGNLYIVDWGNQRIRELSNGVITTIAGNGIQGFTGDNGPATAAALNLSEDSGIAIDAAGNLYISDSTRIRKVSNGVITTIAGNGTKGFRGDNGPATSASLTANGLAVDSTGRIYFADPENSRIRVLIPSTASCSFSISPRSVQPAAFGGNLALSIDTEPFCPWTVSGLPDWVTVADGTAGAGAKIVTLIVTANPGGIRTATVVFNDQTLTVTQPSVSLTLPVIASVNVASGPPAIAQNTWIEITGAHLVPADTPSGGVFWSDAPEFASDRMPTQVGGITVTVNGKPAYVWWFCSAVTTSFCPTDQINVLTPLDTAVQTVQVVVTNGTVSSPAFAITMQELFPSFLVFDARRHIVATHSDFSLVGPASLYPGSTTPARPGETMSVFATGFGLPAEPLVSGSATQSGALPLPLPVCTVGSRVAKVTGAALISPGLYDLTIIIPNSVASGDNPIVCVFGGVNTPGRDLITIQ